jgi:tetratricopeptide (TPR) repeat protein
VPKSSGLLRHLISAAKRVGLVFLLVLACRVPFRIAVLTLLPPTVQIGEPFLKPTTEPNLSMNGDEEVPRDLRFYMKQEPVILALLAVLAIVFFLAVTGLSRVYHAQQASLGDRWFNRGAADLRLRRFDQAVIEFRAALLYSRDNYDYQLNLAEALLGMGRTGEARAYLENLWDREPENGLVSLELARIAAQGADTDQALRYFHNAIYATWPGDQAVQRRQVRLELIEYLLKIDAKAAAQSELIALAANLGDDPSAHVHAGDLFVRAQDYEHALSQYHLSLSADHRNLAALAGAGRAAFELGRYDVAQRYLQAVVAANPRDTASADRLKTTELVLKMDPFRRKIPAAQRNRIVIEAFSAASNRLEACSSGRAAAAGSAAGAPGTGSTANAMAAPPSTSQASLTDAWTKIKPQITPQGLRKNPDLVEAAMDLAFRIERETSANCGTPTGRDLALLLIAKLHEGS